MFFQVFTLLLASFFCAGYAHPFGLLKLATNAVNTASSLTTTAVSNTLKTANDAVNAAVDTTKAVVGTAVNVTSSVVETGKTVTSGVLSTAVNVTSSVVETGKKVTSGVVSTAVNVTDSLTGGAASAIANTVSSTVEKTTNKNYYTVKYAFTIYAKCYRSCLMHLFDDEKREACATERETYCKKVKSYDLQEALGVIATKYATKTALNSALDSVNIFG